MVNLKQRFFNRFLSDERGNITVMFALSLLPMLGFVGAGVDYSRAAMVRSRMQSAVDATALKLARDAPTLSDGDATTMANRYFNAVFDTSDLPGKASLSVSRTDQGVKLAANVNMTPAFMQIFGFATMPLGVSSESLFDNTKIELSLVLDNTGSMAQLNKMVALKDALTNSKTGVLTQIKEMDPTGARVKVAIVPFDTQVNVGSGYQTKIAGKFQHANWLGFSDLGSSFAPKPDPRGKTVADVSTVWSGCVSDRAEPYNTNLSAPSIGTPSTLYPAWQCDTVDGAGKGVLGAIQPLTNNQAALTVAVNAMQPSGNTNVAVGFHWGMRMLESGTTPLGLGVPFGTPNVKKYIVLLTDGDNTQDRFTTTQYQIDSRTQAMCNLIKGNGNVTVFTVRVIEGNASLLQSCASAPTIAIPQTYFEVKTSSGISAALNQILNQITGIRLAS